MWKQAGEMLAVLLLIPFITLATAAGNDEALMMP
jgi:hypothetical protein